jgi:septal ring factor EnvC (AmiA/AmiB activator)
MTTHTDLSRDMGRVEGKQDAMGARLDKIEELLERIDARLAKLEAAEHQRKGAVAALMLFAGFIGGLVAKFGAAVFGGHS